MWHHDDTGIVSLMILNILDYFINLFVNINYGITIERQHGFLDCQHQYHYDTGATRHSKCGIMILLVSYH